jgi:hypothetical protein
MRERTVKRAYKRKTPKPIKVMTLDTETRGLFGEIFRVGLFDGNEYHYSNNAGDIITKLHKFSKKYEVHVFIHNLDFDLSKLAKWLIKGADLKKSIFINNNVAIFKSYSIILHDSLKILPASLSKLCKDFGLEKSKAKMDLTEHILHLGWGLDKDGNTVHDLDNYDKRKSEGNYFKKVSPDEETLNIYLEYDCRSLYEIIQIVIDISKLDLKDFLKCPTTASMAMKVFKTQYDKDYRWATSTRFDEDSKPVEEFLREGYYGGRTEVIKPMMNDSFHYDVNSLYPYVMKAHEYPIGQYEVFGGQKALFSFKYWMRTKKGGGFARAKIHVPEDIHIPPLPVRKGLKLIFPTGNLKGVWAFPEIENAINHGAKLISISDVVYFKKTAPVFQGYINHFEKVKSESKGAKRNFAKLCLNSLYGKFGMRRERKTFMPIEEKDNYSEGEYRECKHKTLGKFIEVETYSNAEYIQPHLSAYVTAHARILLHNQMIEQLGLGDVAYCDTDSIVCEKELSEDKIDENEFGKWALENELVAGLFIQPKLYFEKSKNGDVTKKIKGVPADERENMGEEFFNDLLSSLQNPTEDKKLLFKDKRVRQKFATVLKSKHGDFDKGEYIKKSIRLRAEQKRQINYNENWTKPHHVEMF